LKAEETEIQALNNRYNNLLMIAYEKGCSTGNRRLTIKTSESREPTVDEILTDEPESLPVAAQLGID
jgi:hypothetical protein